MSDQHGRRWPFRLAQERTVRVAEHEVLLSFVDDAGAEWFRSWMRSAGAHAFERWVENRIEERDEMEAIARLEEG